MYDAHLLYGTCRRCKNSVYEGQPMDNKNEILIAVREARRILGDCADFRVAEVLAILEGIAPFLDREVVIGLKCKGCDNYASSSFPLSKDFWVVEE